MEKHYQPWTKKEVEYLETNYGKPTVELEEMVQKLRRTDRAIQAKAFSLGVFRPPKMFREIIMNRKT